MPNSKTRNSKVGLDLKTRCEILHIFSFRAIQKFIKVHQLEKNVRFGHCESPLCDNYTCLVFIILSGCVVALTTFIAHSSWYITVRQNILKYRCMQWEIGILLWIFAGFTTTKKHLRNHQMWSHSPTLFVTINATNILYL